MNNKEFEPSEWLQNNESNSSANTHCNKINMFPSTDQASDIQSLVEQIEASATDITEGYKNWLDLGFALVEALGEDGRDYFHRISRFNAGYDQAEADRQYTACLRSKGSGVTSRTLFHIAKQHGIVVRKAPVSIPLPPAISPESSKSSKSSGDKPEKTVRTESVAEMEKAENLEKIENLEDIIQQVRLPTFSGMVMDSLPDFLRQVAAKAKSEQDADMLILGTITLLSACMPNVSGIYNDREFYPNIYLFVTAPASAGKGRLTLCCHIVQPIHDDMEAEYNADMDEYNSKMADFVVNKNYGEEPPKPTRRTLFIPGNSSSSKFYKTMKDNEGLGIMFETEGDIVASTFKTDYGNYSEGFRSAFQHETMSYNRVKDDALVEIKKPKLSALLSGTPNQIQSLFHDAENGLFSRFLFYRLNIDFDFHVSHGGTKREPVDKYYIDLGYRYYALYRMLENSHPVLFDFTEGQWDQFNETFQAEQNKHIREVGLDMLASMRRLGLATFRIAMVFSVLRIMEHGEIPELILCEDEDFHSALYIAHVLAQHTSYILQGLPKTTPPPTVKLPTQQLQNFFDALPNEFDRNAYLAIAKQLGIPEKTADKHIGIFKGNGTIIHVAHNKYRKPSP